MAALAVASGAAVKVLYLKVFGRSRLASACLVSGRIRRLVDDTDPSRLLAATFGVPADVDRAADSRSSNDVPKCTL